MNHSQLELKLFCKFEARTVSFSFGRLVRNTSSWSTTLQSKMTNNDIIIVSTKYALTSKIRKHWQDQWPSSSLQTDPTVRELLPHSCLPPQPHTSCTFVLDLSKCPHQTDSPSVHKNRTDRRIKKRLGPRPSPAGRIRKCCRVLLTS